MITALRIRASNKMGHHRHRRSENRINELLDTVPTLGIIYVVTRSRPESAILQLAERTVNAHSDRL